MSTEDVRCICVQYERGAPTSHCPVHGEDARPANSGETRTTAVVKYGPGWRPLATRPAGTAVLRAPHPEEAR